MLALLTTANYYYAPGREVKYCDKCVCSSVRPLAYLRHHTLKQHEIFAHVIYGHGSLIFSVAICTSGFVDDFVFVHNLQTKATPD